MEWLGDSDKQADAIRSGFAGGQETILLVEDEDFVRDVTREVLEMAGYKLLEAENAQQGLDIFRQQQTVHLVLTDVIMPGMNGRDLIRELRKHSPNLKCIFMSGYTENSILREDIRNECSSFLQKPFSLEVLTRTVREVLDNDDSNSTS